MVPRAAVFFDGAYMDWLRMKEGIPAVRVHDMVTRMAGGVELFRVYWYDCLPLVKTPEEKAALDRKEKFFAYLRAQPKIEIRLGKIGMGEQGTKLVQKGVDVSLAVDLASLSSHGAISHAHIVTGDNDFAPAVRYAKAMGVAVKLWYGGRSRPGADLHDACDDREEMRLIEFKAEG